MMQAREFTGKHMLLTMLAFFGLIIVANVIFVSYAISSFPGETQTKSYVRGLKYNDVLDDKRRQEALGWRVEILNVGAESGIDLRVVDSAENGLAGLHIEGVAKRPAHEHDDRVLIFQELGAGVYRVGGGELTTGVWDIVAQAERADGEKFNFTTRVRIK